jgi:hypothetical protein
MKLKVDKSSAEIFDLFKIIHTINLTLIYKEKNLNFKKIMSIGESDQIRDYLLSVHLNSKEFILKTNNQKSNETFEQMTEIQTQTMSESHYINEDIERTKVCLYLNSNINSKLIA